MVRVTNTLDLGTVGGVTLLQHIISPDEIPVCITYAVWPDYDQGAPGIPLSTWQRVRVVASLDGRPATPSNGNFGDELSPRGIRRSLVVVSQLQLFVVGGSGLVRIAAFSAAAQDASPEIVSSRPNNAATSTYNLPLFCTEMRIRDASGLETFSFIGLDGTVIAAAVPTLEYADWTPLPLDATQILAASTNNGRALIIQTR